ncbi:acylglycerol kinase, mitochondrial-like [Actinia tenebrosa]|uniref:Acylglycerol kinase, mitochondrial n=1 Tax=Actinia tenebrosa TaxID=6105 RepID=A0A6P8H2S4_ACTTE|nr:acylglycerol kinase, mitochondrial-like [Actinia tenebrosa]
MADEKPRFYTLRKHKKKSIVFAAFGLWLVKYGVNRFREYLTRREFCQEAKVYAEETTPALKKPRRFMLLFNATAGKGEAEKLFQRNAEPLFHLAGLDVTIIKTDYEGQIKTLMQYLDPSIDGIIVAGGDGTLLEVVTGLLRRPDQEQLSKIPFGVIPIGTKNTFYKKIFGNSELAQAKEIGQAAMAIVKGNTHSIDVMEIKGEGGRPTYALSGLQWGAFQDAAESYDKYWITGPFRKKMAYIAATFKNWPPTHQALLSYPTKFTPNNTTLPASSTSKTGGLITSPLTARTMASVLDAQGEINDGSGSGYCTLDGWVHNPLETLGMSIHLIKNIQGKPALNVRVWPPVLPKMDFIKMGWKMDKNSQESDGESETFKCLEVQELKLEPKDEEGSWFNIDGEPFDARPVHITLHPDKLKVFCGKD